MAESNRKMHERGLESFSHGWKPEPRYTYTWVRHSSVRSKLQSEAGSRASDVPAECVNDQCRGGMFQV